MENYLRNPDACFYHITTFSNWEKISVSSLLRFSSKGISVLRTNEMPIVNSVICFQLNSPEIETENDFVLIKIPQSLNHFKHLEIETDVVSEWTWPLQNNIMRDSIPLNNLEMVERFKIHDWHKSNHDDAKYEGIYKNTELYQSSFNIIYEEIGIKYLVKYNKEIVKL